MNIHSEIVERRKRLTKIKPARRTETQRKQLANIRQYEQERRTTPAITRGAIESRGERYDNFRRWSGTKAFPRAIQRQIEALNLENRLDPFDSYGYRVFFHRYVNGATEARAIAAVERRDT